MKHSVLLFLVIALMHSPHEMNCVKIVHDGFYTKIPNRRTCRTIVNATGQIILDEEETLDNLPPSILLQFKCPYYPNDDTRHQRGPKDGSWFLYLHAPLNSCALPAQTEAVRYLMQCWPGTGRTYRMATILRLFFLIKNCSMRYFLGETAFSAVNHRSYITNDHGFKGLTREVPLMEFAEVPYYDNSSDAGCEKALPYIWGSSNNEASDRQIPTDVLVFVCGLVMASSVLSF